LPGSSVVFPPEWSAPVVKMIFHDYVVNGLTITEIERKLNGDLDRYRPPAVPHLDSRWEILHNPKYTPEEWVWSEEPAHEPLVSRIRSVVPTTPSFASDRATAAG